jgi:hypothetical protein
METRGFWTPPDFLALRLCNSSDIIVSFTSSKPSNKSSSRVYGAAADFLRSGSAVSAFVSAAGAGSDSAVVKPGACATNDIRQLRNAKTISHQDLSAVFWFTVSAKQLYHTSPNILAVDSIGFS